MSRRTKTDSRSRSSRRVTNYGKRAKLKKSSKISKGINGEDVSKEIQEVAENIIPFWEDINKAKRAYATSMAVNLANIKGFIDTDIFKNNFANTEDGGKVVMALQGMAKKYTSRMTALSNNFEVTREGQVKPKHFDQYINLYSAWADLTEEMQTSLTDLLVTVSNMMGAIHEAQEADKDEGEILSEVDLSESENDKVDNDEQ